MCLRDLCKPISMDGIDRRAALLDLDIFIQYRHEELQFRNCAGDPSRSFLPQYFGTTASGPVRLTRNVGILSKGAMSLDRG